MRSERTGRARRRRLQLVSAFALIVVAVATQACVTEEYPLDPWAPRPEGVRTVQDELTPEEAANRPLPSYVSVIRVVSGDSLVLPSGKVVRFVGVRAPAEGEPYHGLATAFVRTMLGQYSLVKLVHTVGTSYSDPVWYANVLIENPDPPDVTSHGTVSLVILGLAQGLLRVTPELSDARFMWGAEGSTTDEANAFKPFDEATNQRIRDGFREWETSARDQRKNIWSAVVAD